MGRNLHLIVVLLHNIINHNKVVIREDLKDTLNNNKDTPNKLEDTHNNLKVEEVDILLLNSIKEGEDMEDKVDQVEIQQSFMKEMGEEEILGLGLAQECLLGDFLDTA